MVPDERYRFGVEMHCADCGCLVDQGIRVVPCGTAGCCCLDLPIRQAQPLDAMAEQIRSAFATKNLDAFGQLLADDARWGDDDHPNRCRSRSDVIATFRRVLSEDVDGEVVETTVGPNGVVCRLRVHWPDPADHARGATFFHVYIVRDGKIAEIQRHDDQASALAAVST